MHNSMEVRMAGQWCALMRQGDAGMHGDDMRAMACAAMGCLAISRGDMHGDGVREMVCVSMMCARWYARRYRAMICAALICCLAQVHRAANAASRFEASEPKSRHSTRSVSASCNAPITCRAHATSSIPAASPQRICTRRTSARPPAVCRAQ